VWVVLWADPWVASALPDLGPGWRYLISAALTATVLEFVLQVLLGWPRITVRWEEKGRPIPITTIGARMTRRKPDSQVFVLHVRTSDGGWLGYQLLRALMRFRPALRIRIDQATVVPTAEYGSQVLGQMTVSADNESKGFVVDLGAAPRRPGEWHWADVSWRNNNMPSGLEVNIDYVFDHPSRLVRVLLSAMVRRPSNAKNFQVVGA
jgi:hypothetical protein